jgi:mannan endo-1,6-alpha-mannosidase
MTGKYDGSSGLGQTLSALEIVQANLVPVAKGLVTANGTAAGGNQSAGGAGASSSSGAGASGTATASSVASSTPTGASAVVFVPFMLLLAAGVLTAVLGLN